jgi:NAD(P)-dependent dehydrogenase (short-subunit alcohol dehydrogenase family)
MKSLIVTGSGGGLGSAIAERAGRDGWRVGVLDVNPQTAAAVAGRIPHAVALTADTTDEASVEAAFDAFGEIPDAVVNNAGIARFGPLEEMAVADFRKVVEINLMGTYIVSRAAARCWISAGKPGAIVNITSVNAVHPAPNVGAYGATKAAIAILTEQMAIEWGPKGIRVNAVAPGFIDAGMSSPFFEDPDIRKLRSGGVPLRRLGLAEDIANAVAFLLSDQASYISGHQLVVDGGVINSILAQLPREKPKV